MLGDFLTKQYSEHAPELFTLLLLVMLFVGSSLLRRFVDRLTAQGHLQGTMAGRLHILRRSLLLLVAPLVLLQITGLGGSAWTLLSAVLATVAIGFFGVWSLLANATSALILLTFRPFRVGDDVDLLEPNRDLLLSGTVKDMNLMFTMLTERESVTTPPSTLHVPNSLFFQRAIRVRPPAVPTDSSTPFFAASQFPQPPTGRSSVPQRRDKN